MPTLYSMVNETGYRNRILEMCKFRFWLVHWIDPRSIEHNYACFPSVCVSVNRSVLKWLGYVHNSLPIFTKFCTLFRNVVALSPIVCQTNRKLFADFRRVRIPISAVLRLCVSVNRSVLKRLRPQFFADFHEILRAVQKCGRFIAYCLWDKPEVVCWFQRCADSDFGSFEALLTTFFNRSASNPIHR